MGLLGNIFKVAADLIETPIAVAKDVITMGGALDDKDESYTAKKLKELKNDLINIDRDREECE